MIPSQFIAIKKWVDALDIDNKWRLARVLTIEGEIISLNFHGWSSKHIREYCIHSPNISLPRINSIGYT